MKVNEVLNKLDLFLSEEELKGIKNEAEIVTGILRNELKKKRISAEVFIGGSFAKYTLIKDKYYDVDVFVRFEPSYDKISEILEKIVNKLGRGIKDEKGKKSKNDKVKIEKLHGSRDYFRVWKGKTLFEIIPVTLVKKPKEARNVTDLSYFHVNYVKKKLKDANLRKEIVYAKQFCKAARVYGAESYVSGFSGYALECLIIYFKKFEKMLKELVKLKEGERIIIDPEKLYKSKNEILLEMNESKLKSPIVLVDPTWKERNVLAALNRETFEIFKKSARQFLAKPSEKFFEVEDISAKALKEDAKKKKAEFLEIGLETEKQAGDIAGTKMKKFAEHLASKIETGFYILKKEFDYFGAQKAAAYLIVKPKKEVIRIGPPVEMEKAAIAFKKANKNVFVKNDILHAKIKVNLSAKRFVNDFKKKYAKQIKEMGISELKVV